MNCLACTEPMTRHRCHCGGAWVSEAHLVKKAQEIRGEMVALPWGKRAGDEHRRCPVCASEMPTVELVGVALDRCKAHGIWFDAHELQTVLERAGQLPEAPAPPKRAGDTADTVGGVLQLFGALLEVLAG